MSSKHLFTFANLQPPGEKSGNKLHQMGSAYSKIYDTSAPVICPPGTNPSDFYDVKKLNPAQFKHVDVVNKFDWTLTPSAARKKYGSNKGKDADQYGLGTHGIPYIRMYEYSLNFSSFLNHLKYLIQSGADAVKGTDAQIPSNKPSGENTIYGGAKEFLANVYGFLPDGVRDFIANRADELTVDQTGIPYYLRGYHGLYDVRPTGFRYSIPYFNSDWKTVRNNWGDITGGNNIIGTLAGVGEAIAGVAMSTAETFRTGAYFERPKSYSFHGEGDAITFTFPLYNNVSYESLVRNFELCTMLTYQQLANKTSRVLLDPPVMYEVEIPGKFYSPYAYIANLSIQGLGAQTHRKIKTLSKFVDGGDQPAESNSASKTGDGSTDDSSPKNNQPGRPCKLTEDKTDDESLVVDAIIPDVWEVTITLQSLVPSTKNLYYHALAGANSIYDVKVIEPVLDAATERTKQQISDEANAAYESGEPLPPGPSYTPKFSKTHTPSWQK